MRSFIFIRDQEFVIIKILGLNFSFSCYIALYHVTPISRLFPFLLFSCGVTHERARLRRIQLCSDQLPERVWCALSGFSTLKSIKRSDVLVAGSLLCNFLTRHFFVSQTKTFSRSFKYKGATNISPCKSK